MYQETLGKPLGGSLVFTSQLREAMPAARGGRVQRG